PAGGTALLKVNIKLPRKPGAVEQTLTISSTDPNKSQQTLTFAGGVRMFVEVQPPNGVTFPRFPRVQNIPSLATLVYNGEGKIEYGKRESSSPTFEATIATSYNRAD